MRRRQFLTAAAAVLGGCTSRLPGQGSDNTDTTTTTSPPTATPTRTTTTRTAVPTTTATPTPKQSVRTFIRSTNNELVEQNHDHLKLETGRQDGKTLHVEALTSDGDLSQTDAADALTVVLTEFAWVHTQFDWGLEALAVTVATQLRPDTPIGRMEINETVVDRVASRDYYTSDEVYNIVLNQYGPP